MYIEIRSGFKNAVGIISTHIWACIYLIIFSGHETCIPACPLTFSSAGRSLYHVFPARAASDAEDLTPGQLALGVRPGDGRHAGIQAGYQLALLVVTLLVAVLGGLITGII